MTVSIFARRFGAALYAVLVLLAPGTAGSADLAAAAAKHMGVGQGVYVEAEDGRVLVSQAAARAVHPASVSKVPTTLALLRALGPDHRFETGFSAGGPLKDGAIEGPLVVTAGGDPFFVDENALLVVTALQELGIRDAMGGVRLGGSMLFNWKSNAVGARLQRALEGRVSKEAWAAVSSTNEVEGAVPGLGFGAGDGAGRSTGALLVTHQSQPLIPMLKALNGYSNNVFAYLANATGGIAAVEAAVRKRLPPEWREEIILGDGAGAHRDNRMSPRATVRILRALQEELARHGADLASVLPVSGIDEGTLRKRLAGEGARGVVVGKTGTYGDYGACALAGAMRTRDGGIVYFALLNRGVSIATARRRQNEFLGVLIAELGGTEWGYERDREPAFTRARVVVSKTGVGPADAH